MHKVLVSVEGQTEETFVRQVLAPHLASCGLWMVPVVVTTRRIPGAVSHRGGYLPWPRLRRELVRLLGDSSAVAVTTMYDLYGLPRDTPGLVQVAYHRGEKAAIVIETALSQNIEDARLRPFLQLHEFEALLYVAPAVTNSLLGGDENTLNRLCRTRSSFMSPEDIDDGANSAPSKRIGDLFPAYQKVLDGPRVAQIVGLERIRVACPHFAEWLRWLEGLAEQLCH